jgi:hypothetical protein
MCSKIASPGASRYGCVIVTNMGPSVPQKKDPRTLFRLDKRLQTEAVVWVAAKRRVSVAYDVVRLKD